MARISNHFCRIIGIVPNRSFLKTIIYILILSCICRHGVAQQIADSEFEVPLFTSKYLRGEGPIVYVDEAHFNFHTLEGKYKPFGTVLEKDGYDVRPFSQKFTKSSLSKARILVIANAMADTSNWELPTKSAFTIEEIASIKSWVNEGGSLFLIADHMPAAGASANLGHAFGFGFINGYLYNYKTFDDIDIYYRKDSTLSDTPLTTDIDSIATFNGQAFIIPSDARSILNIARDYIIFLPSEVGKINGSLTPKFYAQGLSQGAYLRYGKGKVVVFGEAGMFSAQNSNTFKIGMNNERAGQNYQLLLNIIHWLDD